MDASTPRRPDSPALIRLSSALSPWFRTVLPTALLLVVVYPWLSLFRGGDDAFSAFKLIWIGFLDVVVLAMATWLLRTKSVYVLGEHILVVSLLGLAAYPRSRVQRVRVLGGRGFDTVRVVLDAGGNGRRKVIWFIAVNRFLGGPSALERTLRSTPE